MKTLSISSLKLKNPLLLAPMVDVTDLPYRLLCRKSGCSLAYTPMLYTSQLLNKNKATLKLIKSNSKDKPLGIQITGSSLKEFEACIPILKKFSLVDINCGCPSIKITGNKAGSYLLKNPEKISEIIKLLKSHGLIVTAKIRLGFRENNVFKTAKAIEKAGADALTLHPRLAIHGSSVPANHEWIPKIKKTVKIPVIANGDIFTGKDASVLLKQCDGIMLARGAFGNPLIFKQILAYLKTGKEIDITKKQRISQLKEYIKLSEKYKVEDLGRLKYIAPQFLKNIPQAPKLRNEFMQLKSIKEIQDFINKQI